MNEKRTVNLPAELCIEAETKFGGRFGSIEQLLEHVLRELLRDESAQGDQVEQRVVEQRLRDLGYI